MLTLTQAEYDAFWRDGVLTISDAVTPEQLAALRGEFQGWVDSSRNHATPYGQMVDGRARFDIEPKSHTADTPALRRVSAPADISAAYLDVISNSRMTDAVADLIGPNVKHHHNKINSKQPGSATEVKWHQDFPFTPHSNTDIVTALLMVDEVTDENGPLEVGLGSHKGPLHSLWHDGIFTGAIAGDIEAEYKKKAVISKGPAGSVCLMHTCVAHGSVPNNSTKPRTLFITVYSAADAAPCSPNPVPNRHEGMMVRGTDPRAIRAVPYSVAIPEYPKTASFFGQQAKEHAKA